MKKIYILAIAVIILMFLYSAGSNAENSFFSALTINPGDNGFIVKGTPVSGGILKSSDRINLLVSNNNFSNNEGIIFIESAGKLKYNSEFSISFKTAEWLPYGKYNVKITKTSNDGSYGEVLFNYLYVDPNDLAECIDGFNSTDTAEFSDIFQLYSFEKEILNVSFITGLPESITTDFSGKFILMRSYLFNTFLGTDDILECLKAAVLLSSFDKGEEEAVKYLDVYGYLFDSLFDSDSSLSEWLTVYADLKKYITTAAELEKVFKKCNILSYIQNASNTQTADILEKYAEELGCDLSYAAVNGVSLNQVAKMIDKTKASDLYSGFGQKFKDIVDELKTELSSPYSPPVKSGGGSSGSSGKTYPVVIPEEPQENPSENFSDLVFDDLEKTSWAKEAILRLEAKKIISGNGNRQFEPERNITREEFLKMLVEAFELKVNGASDIEFNDCIEGEWYYPYIRIGVAADIITGISETEFGISQNITRQDMAVMARRILISKSFTIVDDSNSDSFNNEIISEYAKAPVRIMAKLGIITGFEDGTFRGLNFATRAQAAVIIDRLMQYLEA